MPERHGSFHSNALGGFYARLVHFGMNRLATQGVDVFVKHVLQVNQATLARTIVPVLQGRQRDLFRLGCHVDSLVNTLNLSARQISQGFWIALRQRDQCARRA